VQICETPEFGRVVMTGKLEGQETKS
jgi:hypothetical protein